MAICDSWGFLDNENGRWKKSEGRMESGSPSPRALQVFGLLEIEWARLENTPQCVFKTKEGTGPGFPAQGMEVPTVLRYLNWVGKIDG